MPATDRKFERRYFKLRGYFSIKMMTRVIVFDIHSTALG